MQRKIVKHYDEVNECWIINYYHVWPESLKVQQFRTPILSGRNRYVGYKSQVGDTAYWYGKKFLQEALAQFSK